MFQDLYQVGTQVFSVGFLNSHEVTSKMDLFFSLTVPLNLKLSCCLEIWTGPCSSDILQIHTGLHSLSLAWGACPSQAVDVSCVCFLQPVPTLGWLTP